MNCLENCAMSKLQGHNKLLALRKFAHCVYVATGLNLAKKFMNTNGCRISFHRSSELQR